MFSVSNCMTLPPIKAYVSIVLCFFVLSTAKSDFSLNFHFDSENVETAADIGENLYLPLFAARAYFFVYCGINADGCRLAT